MMGVPTNEVELVLGYWDEHIKKEIPIVKKELEHGNDAIFTAIENETDANNKTCTNGHININVRKNRKYCTVCKGVLTESESFNTQEEEEEDLEPSTLPHKRLNLDISEVSSTKHVNVNFTEMKPKEKSDLYENVRNHYSKEEPVIESSGVVMVNPNTFGRIKKVFNFMIDKSGLTNKYSHSITFEDDDSITITHSQKEDDRVFIVVTCDGLPHLVVIKIIENCYICEECNIKFESLLSVSVHK